MRFLINGRTESSEDTDDQFTRWRVGRVLMRNLRYRVDPNEAGHSAHAEEDDGAYEDGEPEGNSSCIPDNPCRACPHPWCEPDGGGHTYSDDGEDWGDSFDDIDSWESHYSGPDDFE